MIYIDDLVGVRYCHNGRNRESGFDCYGLAIEVCKRFGYQLPDLEDFKKDDRDFIACEDLCKSQVKVKRAEMPEKEGDVILLKNPQGVMNHIGVYMGNGRFIHCNKLGVHLDKLSNYSHLIGRTYVWL